MWVIYYSSILNSQDGYLVLKVKQCPVVFCDRYTIAWNYKCAELCYCSSYQSFQHSITIIDAQKALIEGTIAAEATATNSPNGQPICRLFPTLQL